eukprot:scaffold22577_cov122-Cylindrotheca_fusiformis.AAC.35
MTAPSVLATPPHLQVQKLEGTYTMAAVDAAAGKWQPLHNIGLHEADSASRCSCRQSRRAGIVQIANLPAAAETNAP